MTRTLTGTSPVLRRIVVLLAALLASAWLVTALAPPAAAAGGERMKDFTVTYDVDPQGTVAVTEHITWQFPAGEQRRGIFRNIVVRMGIDGEPNKYRYFEMTGVSVSSPTGAPAAFTVTDKGAANQILIGDPNRYTSGTQEYVIKYTLHNAVNPITGEDGAPDTVEFHFNVFGTNEMTQRDVATVTVNAPAASTKAVCYFGESGSTTQCTATAGRSTTFSARNLLPGDAMTVISSYPASAFDNPTADIRDGSQTGGVSPGVESAVSAAATAAGIGAPIVAAALMGTLVWTRGRDERYADLTPGLSPSAADAAGQTVVRGGKQTVAVQFHPPTGVQPGMVGTIIDEVANPIDVSATLIDLAVRGYLRIEEGEKGMFKRSDWTLTRLAPPANDPVLLGYERTLLDGVFKTGDVVTLSGLKNTFATTLKRIQSQMYGEVVQRGWFRSSPEAQRTGWKGLGMVLGLLGVLMLFMGRGMVATILGGAFTGGAVLAVGLILAGVITWVLGGMMPSRTAEGSAVLAQSLGFKEYLVTAEAGQIAFEEASNIFSRYLPYAVVFGVADRWAKTFAEVARAAEAANQTIIMPTWYVWGPGVVPDFTSITDGVSDFSTVSTGTFTSTPGSSGSSGFSGGGGFSGSGMGGSSSGSW